MHSICLLGVQVAVEGEEWMVLAIGKINMIMAYFERKDFVQRNLYIRT